MANSSKYGITWIKDYNGNWRPLKGLWQKTALGWKPVTTAWSKKGVDSWERIYPTPSASITSNTTSLSYTVYQNHNYNDSTSGQTVTITNTGDQALLLTEISAQDSSNYISTIRLANIAGNVLPANIAPNASVSVSINVFGKLIGNSSGSLTFTGNSGILGTITNSIPINVAVLPEYSTVTISPSVIDYSMYINDLVPSKTITISNNGNGASLQIISITSKYGHTSIGSYPSTLASKSSTTVTLTAHAEPTGAYRDSIVITTNHPETPIIEVPVTFTVLAQRPVISTSPSSLNFSIESISNQPAIPLNATTQIVFDLSSPSKYIPGTNANVAPHYYFSSPLGWDSGGNVAISELTGQRCSNGVFYSKSVTITYPSTPTKNNLLVCCCSWAGIIYNQQPLTVPPGWILATRGGQSNDGQGDWINSAIYYKIAGASEPTTHQWTFSNEVDGASFVASEWSGCDTINPLDRTNLNSGYTVSGSSGATGTLSQTNELVILSFSNLLVNLPSTWSSYTNDATEILEISSPNGGAVNTAMVSKISSATDSINYGATLSPDSQAIWSSAIATFRGVSKGNQDNYKLRVLSAPDISNIGVTSTNNKIIDLTDTNSYVAGTNTEVGTYTDYVSNSIQITSPTIDSKVAVIGWQTSSSGVEERTLTSKNKVNLRHVNSLVYEIAADWWGFDANYKGENLKIQYSVDGVTWNDIKQHDYNGPWTHSFYNYYSYWNGYYGWERYNLLDWFYGSGYWYYGNGWQRAIVSVPDAARISVGGVYLRYYQRRIGQVDRPQDTWALSSVSSLASNVVVFGDNVEDPGSVINFSFNSRQIPGVSTVNLSPTFLNQYAVWAPDISSGTFDAQTVVNFPFTGPYTFSLQVDNTGEILLDGTSVISITDIYNYSKSPVSITRNVSAGPHTVRVRGSNYGAYSTINPAGIALLITGTGRSDEVRTITSTGKVILNDVDQVVFQVNRGTSAGWGTTPATGESVQLQYSIDGNTWVDIISITQDQVANDKWTTFNTPVPGPAKSTSGVYLRYYQYHSGANSYRGTWAMTAVGVTTWLTAKPSSNVAITNTGGGALNIISVASESSLTTFTNVPTIVNQGTPETFIVTATGVSGDKTDRIVITSNSAVNPVSYIPVTYNYTARQPKISISPTKLITGELYEFGGDIPAPSQIFITNNGNAPLSIKAATAHGRVSLVAPIPVSIDPGTTQILIVAFPDWDKNEVFDTVYITSNDPVNGTISVDCEYAAIYRVPIIRVKPSSYTIPNFKVGSIPASAKIIISNAPTATGPLNIQSGNIISRSGNISLSYTPSGPNFNPGSYTTLTADFAAYANYPVGPLNDVIYIRSNDNSQPNIAVPIVSTILPSYANISVSSTSTSYNSVTGINVSAPAYATGPDAIKQVIFTVKNSGERNLTISSIDTQLGYGYVTNTNDSSITFPAVIPPGTSVDYKFKTATSLQPGLNSDYISINSDASNGSLYKIPYTVNATDSHGSQTFNTAGSFTWTAPSWINNATVYITGGGGGGGAALGLKHKPTGTGSGGGGGSGGISTVMLSHIPSGTVFTGQVGAGGAGGIGTTATGTALPGNWGTLTYFYNSTFGNLVAQGGQGGGSGASINANIGSYGGYGGVAGFNGIAGLNGASVTATTITTSTPPVLGGKGGRPYSSISNGAGGDGAASSNPTTYPYALTGSSGFSGNVYIVW